MMAGNLPGACTRVVLNIMENMLLHICTHSLRPSCMFVCFKGPMFTKRPINGFKCCVIWVVLHVRVRGSVHSCCLSTVSTCLAIHEHHLGLFLKLILDHCASLLNSHYLQHTKSTRQVMRVSAIYRGNYEFPDTR